MSCEGSNVLYRRYVSWAFCVLSALSFSTAWGEDAKDDDKDEASFIRVVRNERGTPVTMETSIVSFSNGKTGEEEATIDLVSAIHVGDRQYYDKLNDLFAHYDALLYELVAPEGSTQPIDQPTEASIPSRPCKTDSRSCWGSNINFPLWTTKRRISSTPTCLPKISTRR